MCNVSRIQEIKTKSMVLALKLYTFSENHLHCTIIDRNFTPIFYRATNICILYVHIFSVMIREYDVNAVIFTCHTTVNTLL